MTQANVSVSNIGESGQLISVALETFDSIFQNIAAANELVESMVTKVSKVDDVATNVAAISEEQAASSQEILATSDTMVSQAQEITRSSTHAAEDSKELVPFLLPHCYSLAVPKPEVNLLSFPETTLKFLCVCRMVMIPSVLCWQMLLHLLPKTLAHSLIW